MRALVVTGILIISLTLAGREAGAQPSARDRAATLFNEAASLFERGMYLDALKKFRQARAVYPSFKIDLNIGATLDIMGRRTEAAQYFERFLVNADKAPPAIISAARKRLEQLRQKLARLKVTCLVDGAVVRANGRSVGRTPVELSSYHEPRRYEISASKRGYRDAKTKATLVAGATQTVDLVLEPPSAEQPAATHTASQPARTPASAAALSQVPRPGPQQELARRRRVKTISGYILLGAGAALTAASALTFIIGTNKGDEAYKSYSEATVQADMDRHWSDLESAREVVYGGIAMSVAAAAVCSVAAYQLLTRPSAAEISGATTPTINVGPRPGGALLGIQGSF